MKPKESKRFEILYDRHLKKLKLQGKSRSTISAYARAVRRLTEHFGCCPDKLSTEQLETYFVGLVENYSWSTVKLDRLGLMFFWEHVLEQDWQWLNIIKPPPVKTIPDILTREEIALLIHSTQKLRYRVFLFTTYSMGLRLQEALSLQIGDIDAGRRRVHIRRGKGHKDRLVPLPDRTLKALRILWQDHRHPRLLFPNYRGSAESIIKADSHMNIGSTQQAMKAVVTACNIKKKSRSTPSGTASPRIYWKLA
jgi:integrase